MNKSKKVLIFAFLSISITVIVIFGIRKYIKVNNPTFGMTTNEKIYYYFNIKITDDDFIEEEKCSPGLVAYKLHIQSFDESFFDSITNEYKEYQLTSNDLCKNNLNIDWWNIDEYNVKKSFIKLESPKRDIGAKTAEYRLIFTEENNKTYIYMLYID